MIISGTHYDPNCLCDGCKQAGNKRYIGGGVYNENKKPMKTMRERFDEFVKGNNLYEKLIESFLEKESFIDFIEQELKKEREDIVDEILVEQACYGEHEPEYQILQDVLNTIKNRV